MRRLLYSLFFTCACALLHSQETLIGDTLSEIEVISRRRVSPLRVLTVDPPSWETSITHIPSLVNGFVYRQSNKFILRKHRYE